ncbi:MAG: WGR domain-containing protein [Labilithrix sp.]
MRRFEMREGTSSKFWEVAVEGRNVVVRFGRIGTDGQTKKKAAASPDAAQKEADKLVREKTAKGYVEIGAKPAAKPAARPAAKPAAKPTGTFAFTSELDALYAKGWPWLRTLTDEAVTAAKATAEAVKGLNAIDPYFPTAIPRETARRYLRGYTRKRFTAELKQQVAADTQPVDLALLHEIIEKRWGPSPSVSYGDETYNFRLAEIVFLFEAFLGTEVVATAIVDHLVRARDHVKWWGDFVDHHHQSAARLAPVVGWLRLRMSPAAWKKLVAPLRNSKVAKLPNYCALLNALADDKVASDELAYLLQRRDVKAAKQYFAENPKAWFHDPQFFFVAGADLLTKVDTSKLKQLAKWQQLRLIDEMGTMQGPGAVRLVSALVESRSAGAQAAAWLVAHGVEVKKGAAPPAKVNRRELEKQVLAIFTGIEKLLVAQKGDAKKERKVMDEAFAKYAELRAALDDVTPEAYFTHHFADVTPKWKVDDATAERWINLAVEAASA